MPSLRCVWHPDLAAESYIEVDSFHVGSGHQSPGLWRHPEDESWRFNEISHWVELAKLLEEAKFHGIFIADVLGEFVVQEIEPGRSANTKEAATMSTRSPSIPQRFPVPNGPSTSHWPPWLPWLR